MKRLRLFGTSGIRGKAFTEMTPELAVRFGSTFATFLGNAGMIAVGRDVRLSAKALSNALISGVLSGGVNVIDYGVAPTPAVLWALKRRKLDGAVIITGSHTPKEMIGFLFFMKDTAEFSVEEAIQFERIFSDEPKPSAWSQVGKRIESDLSEVYLESVLSQVNTQKLASSGFKVVLDPGNGASAPFCPKIFQAAGVETLIINGEPNGSFPARDPYPRPEILGDLSRKVKESGAEVGSAADADGDRSIFSDHKGRILWGDVSGCVFVKDALLGSGGGTVVAPINSSQLIGWVCNSYHGKVLFTKVGPPSIVSALKREKAIIGLEETGKNIWPQGILYGDWILSTLKMLEILVEEQKSLSQIIAEFPRFHMRKKAFDCPEILKGKVLTRALREWENRGEEAEVVTIDGVRINYPDGSWMLLRPSGTEPVFRVYSESPELGRCEELSNIGSEIVQRSLMSANKMGDVKKDGGEFV